MNKNLTEFYNYISHDKNCIFSLVPDRNTFNKNLNKLYKILNTNNVKVNENNGYLVFQNIDEDQPFEIISNLNLSGNIFTFIFDFKQELITHHYQAGYFNILNQGDIFNFGVNLFSSSAANPQILAGSYLDIQAQYENDEVNQLIFGQLSYELSIQGTKKNGRAFSSNFKQGVATSAFSSVFDQWDRCVIKIYIENNQPILEIFIKNLTDKTSRVFHQKQFLESFSDFDNMFLKGSNQNFIIRGNNGLLIKSLFVFNRNLTTNEIDYLSDIYPIDLNDDLSLTFKAVENNSAICLSGIGNPIISRFTI